MDLQSTFDYLMQIRKKEYAIKRKQLLCEELRSSLGARATQYDRDRVQTSPVDKVSEIICKVADLEDQIEQLQEEKALLIIEIGDAIEQLENDNEKVPMAQVAKIINYSVRRTYYFRKQGVLHLGEALGGN